MIDRAVLKSRAKEQIKGNIPFLILCMLLIGVIVGGLTAIIPILGGIASFVVTPVLSIGIIKIFLGLAQGEKPSIEKLFSALPIFLKAFLLQIITSVIVGLWSLLLFVPGIIKALSYMFAPFILAENHDVEVMDALKLSQKITDGHKGKLAILILSFFPWMLLVAVTFGIAIIYVAPYMEMTITNAYNELKYAAGIETTDHGYAADDNSN